MTFGPIWSSCMHTKPILLLVLRFLWSEHSPSFKKSGCTHLFKGFQLCVQIRWTRLVENFCLFFMKNTKAGHIFVLCNFPLGIDYVLILT
jgi:hypothetical protein